MALDCKAGVLTAATGSGSQSVTGLGFQPKLVIFFMGDQTADGTGPDSQFNVGGSDGTSQFAVSPSSEDGVGTASAAGQLNSARCLILNSPGTTASIRTASFSSMDADGFTISWIETGSAYKIGYLALGGADLTNVYIGSLTTPSASGTQAITGVGFQPDCLLTISTRGTDAGIMLGAADGTNQCLVGNASEDNKSTSDTYRYEVGTKCIGLLNNSGVLAEGSLSSFDADGFTLNWSTGSAFGNDHYFIAMKGASFAVGSDTQNTTTGTKTTTVSGMTPKALILMSANKTVGSSVVSGASVSLGVATGTTERAHLWAGDADAQATMQADNDWDSAAALKMISPGATPTLNAEADLSSFAADEFTLNWTTADATARGFCFVAFGDAGGGGGGGEAVATVAGSSVANGTGAAVVSSAFSSVGSSACSGSSEATAPTDGSSSGSSTASGAGASTVGAVGGCLAAATVNGVSISEVSSDGSATGSASVGGVAQPIASAVASSQGSSTASATASIGSVASSAGVASVDGQSATTSGSYNELAGLGSHAQANCQLHYELDETSGTTAFDTSGNSDNATHNGSTTTGATTGGADWLSVSRDYPGSASAFTEGIDGLEYDFDGTTPFSFGGWFAIDSGAGTPVSKMDSFSSYRGWDIYMDSSNQSIHANFLDTAGSNGINVVTGAGKFSVGNFVHVMVTYDGSKNASGVKVYVNGVSESLTVNQNNLTGTLAHNAPFVVGGRSSGSSASVVFDGRVSDVFVFDKELSALEVLDVLNGPEPLNSTAPVLSNDGTVTSGTWDDRNHGTLSRQTTLYRTADDTFVAVSSSLNPDFSASMESGTEYYVVERGINDGGYDPAEDTASASVIFGGANGSSSGSGAASGVGASTAESTGSAAGSGVGSGVGASSVDSIGSAAGSGVASGVGSSGSDATASAGGSSTVSATGAAIFEATASSLGSATASGVSEPTGSGTGSADGTSSVTGEGASTVASVASSSGLSTVAGNSDSAVSVASSAGSSVVSGVGTGVLSTIGSAGGTSVVSGVGAVTSVATLASEGIATVNFVGEALFESVGSVTAVATAIGYSTDLTGSPAAYRRRMASSYHISL